MAQLAEQEALNFEVAGSSPAGGTLRGRSSIWLEYKTVDLGVAGSSPVVLALDSKEVIMVPFRIIGDVHGKVGEYKKLIEDAEYSVQLGDMGFDYSGLSSVDQIHHRFIPGNHDDYDNLPIQAFQSDWGQVGMGHLDFFYIRGAYSVDKMLRIPGISWWQQEQMGWEAAYEMLPAIQTLQPKYILSHDCPEICMNEGVVTNGMKLRLSTTTQIMNAVFEVWQPDLWVFGHHHRDWTKKIGKTKFVCLNELSTLDLFPEDES